MLGMTCKDMCVSADAVQLRRTLIQQVPFVRGGLCWSGIRATPTLSNTPMSSYALLRVRLQEGLALR
jgi:hypothetical protein